MGSLYTFPRRLFWRKWQPKVGKFFYLYIAFFTVYSRYLKRVISKRDGCEYLKQVPSIDGSLELI
jgi:hypothetical protein